MSIPFGELRALLQRQPSAAQWSELCTLLAQPSWEEEVEQWLPYALDHLDQRWPDERRLWPLDWLERDPPWWATRLVRHIKLHNDMGAQMQRLLAQLDSHRAPELGVLYVSELTGHTTITIEQVEALLTHPRIAQLRILRLGQAVCVPQTMALGCALPLEQLMYYVPPESVEAVEAAFTPTETLTHLAMPCTKLERIAAMHLPALRELRLLCHHVTHAGIDAMVAAPWFAQLRYLNINTRFGRADSSPDDILERLRALGAKVY